MHNTFSCFDNLLGDRYNRRPRPPAPRSLPPYHRHGRWGGGPLFYRPRGRGLGRNDGRGHYGPRNDCVGRGDRPLLCVPRIRWSLRGSGLRTRRCTNDFLGEGGDFFLHAPCLFCQGRGVAGSADAHVPDRDAADPYAAGTVPPEGPAEASVDPDPTLGLRPIRTSIPSSSSSSSSSSVLGEASSGSPSLASALQRFSSESRANIFLRARFFSSSFFFFSLATSRRASLAAASSRTKGQAVQKPRSL
jgi:hypothetical protein